jgi:broad specificity phosphatase PhoE
MCENPTKLYKMLRYNRTMQTTILLVRHGEVHNPRGVFYGRLPRFGLSALGRRQAAAAAEALSGANSPLIPRAFFCSPMLRTRQTAQWIAGQYPGLRRRLSRQLTEVYSPYDGCPMAVLESRDWEIYEGIPANYEQPADVLARILNFCTEVRRQFPGECVLAVTHGDLIYFLTLWALGHTVTTKKNQTFYPAHASISSFVFDGDGSGLPEYSYHQPEVS